MPGPPARYFQRSCTFMSKARIVAKVEHMDFSTSTRIRREFVYVSCNVKKKEEKELA